jgi:hypothetical protein
MDEADAARMKLKWLGRLMPGRPWPSGRKATHLYAARAGNITTGDGNCPAHVFTPPMA